MIDRPKPKENIPAKKVSNGGGLYFAEPNNNVPKFPSGSKLLDLALGGGWAENRICNVIGDSAAGKTLIAIEACANFARKYPNGIIKYRESEAAFDTGYAGALGMPIDRVDFGENIPFFTVEDMSRDIEETVKTVKTPTLYVVDSLDALSDVAEMERDIGDNSYGAAKAKKLSELFRKLTQPLQDKNITLMIISQIRDKINALPFQQKWTRAGGKALQFYCSQVIFLTQTGTIKVERSGIKRVIGTDVTARVTKNKVGLSFREAEFSIVFGYGIDDTNACLDWLKTTKSLSLIDLKDTDIKHYVARLEKMDDKEYWAEIDRIHVATTQKWFDIEKSLLTERRKY